MPLSDAGARVHAAEPALIDTILTGGDDYEVLCTMAPEKLASFRAASAVAGVPVTEIGRVVEGQGAHFLDPRGKLLTFARPSFSHF